MTVTKAKAVDKGLMTLGSPNRVVDRNYTIPLRYDMDNFSVQIPRTYILRSVYEVNGKFFIDLAMMKYGAFDQVNKMLSDTCDSVVNSMSLFENHVSCNNSVKVHDDVYRVRVKLPKNGSSFLSRIWQDNEEVTVYKLHESYQVICILDVDCFYTTGKEISFNFLLKECKILP